MDHKFFKELSMKFFISFAILFIWSTISMTTFSKENASQNILCTYAVDTHEAVQDRTFSSISLLDHSTLTVVSDQHMRDMMGDDLEDLRNCANIEFHKFSPSQIALYPHNPSKIIEIKQGKANVFTAVSLKEDRLIYSPDILDCVGLYVGKPSGPIACAHLDSCDIETGKVARILSRFKSLNAEEKATFQVYLISGSYSADLRHIYAALKSEGFKVSGKSILPIFSNVSQKMFSISLSALGIEESQLQDKSAADILDIFAKRQETPLIPQVLAATLGDGKFYGMQESLGLMQVVRKPGFISKLQDLMTRLSPLDLTKISPGTKQAMVDQLKAGNSVEQVLKLFPELKNKS
jgi:hypothetical protein